MNSQTPQKENLARKAVHFAIFLTLLACAVHLSAASASAQGHTVFVEGNCDSPVPGTTIVAAGTCGDFDGDTRIGTAEDTDGADRIFGTINAALGTGTGAAAGTGINHNGSIVIVASGRFAEAIFIGQNQSGPGAPGIESPGNVTLEAAPGVKAVIDAILQGDPSGGNNIRQTLTGIGVSYVRDGATRTVNLRNLTVRNFANGIVVSSNSRVHIENCRVENSNNFGIRVADNSRAVITNTQVTGTGFRLGTVGGGPAPGTGIRIEQLARVRMMDSAVTQSRAFGIENLTGSAGALVLFHVGVYFSDAADIFGPFTDPTSPNTSNGAPVTSDGVTASDAP